MSSVLNFLRGRLGGVWIALGLLAGLAGAAEPGPSPAASAASSASSALPASASSAASAPASLDARVQDLKADVIRLNRDLLVLEEELQFPASTQVAVFVSLDVGKLFTLDSVRLLIDDKVVTQYLYTPRELAALQRGAVQRLYLGNLRSGEHTLVATLIGQGPHQRDYQRGATLKFDKGSEPRFIELRIVDDAGKLQPDFSFKTWQ